MTFLGVVRQQLPALKEIPFTSHNSAACVLLEGPDAPETTVPMLADLAGVHITRHFLVGSDPGLCVAAHGQAVGPRLSAFALRCTHAVVSRGEARSAARLIHLSEHGGTGDGIIGAAAAVGFTAAGWHGPFIEWRGLRELPGELKVSDLNRLGIRVVSMDRDACIPAPRASVTTQGWLPACWEVNRCSGSARRRGGDGRTATAANATATIKKPAIMRRRPTDPPYRSSAQALD